MSKTTIALIILLLLALGGFLYVTFRTPQTMMMTSLTPKTVTKTPTADVTLSLASNLASLQRGQTVTVSANITPLGLKPTLTQLELAYDPTVLTEVSVLPGTFFTKPTIVLQTISPDLGRISYALKCPMQTVSEVSECSNAGATNVATITFLVNPLASTDKTTITFLPKSLVRNKNGTDILSKITNLTLPIGGIVAPVASSSGQIVPTP